MSIVATIEHRLRRPYLSSQPSNTTTVAAPHLNWVSEDGTGRLNRCIYTNMLASAHDTNLKRIRFIGFGVFNLSIGVLLMTLEAWNGDCAEVVYTPNSDCVFILQETVKRGHRFRFTEIFASVGESTVRNPSNNCSNILRHYITIHFAWTDYQDRANRKFSLEQANKKLASPFIPCTWYQQCLLVMDVRNWPSHQLGLFSTLVSFSFILPPPNSSEFNTTTTTPPPYLPSHSSSQGLKVMVRSVKNNHHQEEEEEEDEEDFVSRTTDASSHKDRRRNNDQKASSHRSKHSETEQRRRSKINERFQILRDLIPENDQKRDRASFLLEVIQYIQFLQEKLQVYEGTYQGYPGWSSEPTKLIPWRGNCGTDNFADQSHPTKNGSVDEGNIVLTQAMFTDPHHLIEPDMSGLAAFKATDHVDVSLQQNTYEPEPTHAPQGSFPEVDPLTSQSRPHTWNAIPFSSEGATQSCTPSVLEESSISNSYSKGLLNNLTHALSSCGVDLSQANISVQLDIRKGMSSGATSTSFGIKGVQDHEFVSQAMTHCGVRRGDDVSNQEHKRPRTEENQ
ncbi:hypothetical protein QVD17_04751 [Tagetes erecta]|uniref:BHLH domain-containing protein n=1 Tax=Tagetes erecta TaxID=13708 RepID=A0AAD8LG41_TARER|nr:hypothetical protein QVD17_04751 [Tagetes erecta]